MTTQEKINYKTCTECGETLPATTEYFNSGIANRGKYGVTSKCRPCAKAKYKKVGTPANKVIINCFGCNEEKLVPVWTKHEPRKYCSRECMFKVLVVQKDNLYKQCSRCGEVKLREDFPKRGVKAYRTSYCHTCRNERAREQNKALETKNVVHFFRKRIRVIKSSPKGKEMGMDIDADYLVSLWNAQEGECALTGIPMTMVQLEGRKGTNVSVDRIDNTKGYLKGNVHLVLDCVNTMKRAMTLEYFLDLCSAITDKQN